MEVLIKEYLEQFENYKDVKVIGISNLNGGCSVLFNHSGSMVNDVLDIDIWKVLVFINNKINDKIK